MTDGGLWDNLSSSHCHNRDHNGGRDECDSGGCSITTWRSVNYRRPNFLYLPDNSSFWDRSGSFSPITTSISSKSTSRADISPQRWRTRSLLEPSRMADGRLLAPHSMAPGDVALLPASWLHPPRRPRPTSGATCRTNHQVTNSDQSQDVHRDRHAKGGKHTYFYTCGHLGIGRCWTPDNNFHFTPSSSVGEMRFAKDGSVMIISRMIARVLSAWHHGSFCTFCTSALHRLHTFPCHRHAEGLRPRSGSSPSVLYKV